MDKKKISFDEDAFGAFPSDASNHQSEEKKSNVKGFDPFPTAIFDSKESFLESKENTESNNPWADAAAVDNSFDMDIFNTVHPDALNNATGVDASFDTDVFNSIHSDAVKNAAGVDTSFDTDVFQSIHSDVLNNAAGVDTSFDTDVFRSIHPDASNNAAAVDTSFDTDVFQFSAKSSVVEDDNAWGSPSLFPDLFQHPLDDSFEVDPFAMARQAPQQKVHVTVQEQLSIMFDDVSPSPSSKVTGSIQVKPAKRKGQSFCLTVKDPKGHMEQSEEREGVCDNVTVNFPHLALDEGDLIYRVSMRDPYMLEAPIASYSCVPRLKPMPMLLKTKVKTIENGCRVGIRIRANPGNRYALTQMAILIIVPPDVSGESVSMSRKGGIWDGMKRTMSWTVQTLEPGETLDIQAQFQVFNGGGSIVPKFPILIRCDGKSLFSGIKFDADFSDSESIPVNMALVKCSRILYRQV